MPRTSAIRSARTSITSAYDERADGDAVDDEVAEVSGQVDVDEPRVDNLDLAHVAVEERRTGEVGDREARATERVVVAVVVITRRPSMWPVLRCHRAIVPRTDRTRTTGRSRPAGEIDLTLVRPWRGDRATPDLPVRRGLRVLHQLRAVHRAVDSYQGRGFAVAVRRPRGTRRDPAAGRGRGAVDRPGRLGGQRIGRRREAAPGRRVVLAGGGVSAGAPTRTVDGRTGVPARRQKPRQAPRGYGRLRAAAGRTRSTPSAGTGLADTAEVWHLTVAGYCGLTVSLR